ncbi:lasso peptide biosynthesis PqqD family chaperone [Wenjunlia vitaminophila]|nr:lasso peptide biosynthesis PqqD family chaperone [Wenjunlia vitaminophila]
MISPAHRAGLRLRRDVTACDTGTGMVLLDERAGRYWQLNSTGARVLRALLDGDTPDQVTDALTATAGGVPRARVAADVHGLLTRLAAARLTEPAPAR